MSMAARPRAAKGAEQEALNAVQICGASKLMPPGANACQQNLGRGVQISDQIGLDFASKKLARKLIVQRQLVRVKGYTCEQPVFSDQKVADSADPVPVGAHEMSRLLRALGEKIHLRSKRVARFIMVKVAQTKGCPQPFPTPGPLQT